jgi:peroxiredoxin
MSKQSRRPNRATRHVKPPAKSTQTRWPLSSTTTWTFGILLLVAALLGGTFLFGGAKTSGSVAGEAAPLALGSNAPSFSGTDVISGQAIDAKSLAGKNVLYYFSEGAGCQACMVQIQALQQHLVHLQQAHLTLVSITNDNDSTLGDAASGYKITTPLISDADRSLTKRFGALGGGMHVDTASHTFILVDKSGKVRFDKDFPSMWVDVPALLKQLPKVA